MPLYDGDVLAQFAIHYINIGNTDIAGLVINVFSPDIMTPISTSGSDDLLQTITQANYLGTISEDEAVSLLQGVFAAGQYGLFMPSADAHAYNIMDMISNGNTDAALVLLDNINTQNFYSVSQSTADGVINTITYSLYLGIIGEDDAVTMLQSYFNNSGVEFSVDPDNYAYSISDMIANGNTDAALVMLDNIEEQNFYHVSQNAADNIPSTIAYSLYLGIITEDSAVAMLQSYFDNSEVEYSLDPDNYAFATMDMISNGNTDAALVMLDNIEEQNFYSVSQSAADGVINTITYSLYLGIIGEDDAVTMLQSYFNNSGVEFSVDPDNYAYSISDMIANGNTDAALVMLDNIEEQNFYSVSQNAADNVLNTTTYSLYQGIIDEGDAVALLQSYFNNSEAEYSLTPNNVQYALQDLQASGSYDAFSVLADNVTSFAAHNMDPGTLDSMFSSLIGASLSDADAIGALDAFMGSPMAANIDALSINNGIIGLAWNGIDEGLNAIVDNLSGDQLDAIPEAYTNFLENFTSTYILTSGNDVRMSEEGSETIFGGAGNDFLYSHYNVTGNDTIYGNDGNDLLVGSYSRSDTIIGGDGADTMVGGAIGADTFVFNNGDSGLDTIMDFSVEAGDILDISDVLQGFDPLTEAIGDFVAATLDGTGTTISVGGTEIVHLSNVAGISVESLLLSGNLIVTDTGPII